ncbi:hypothetical protein [Chryseolinea lacunae]|uniref:Uncharacterized protein n=1 Tax=Chryseolinea lacunae TaxID=2801331 RepID=A0ABS1KRM8_9BACT|nr:hypothetical protein [Chryseolinea lacunae]MBL0742111.1 hypothetical protein [Chryseolinea lacunae]
MKLLITFLVAALVSISATTHASSSGHGETLKVGGSKHRTFFVFKAQKKFVGATVEVFTSQGALLTSQALERRKMIIDFGNATTDTYTIRITKGEAQREFQYIKQ